MTGIAANPARQAHDAVRGYVFQVLRCVDAWLHLLDGEEIFMEGGEDLDLISGCSATLDQIKDTVGSGNISLRTSSVIDTINNHWAHVEANPTRTVRTRYVTTSQIGFERDHPFGELPGLALWNSTGHTPNATSLEAAGRLVAFILKELKPSVSLHSFLTSANPEVHLARLIGPMTWMAGQEDCDSLVRRIKDRLVEHGAASSVAPTDAEQAFDKLYVAAFDAARTRGAPALTRGGFLRLFAEATTIQLPKQDLAALIAAARRPSDDSQLVEAGMVVLEAAPPILPRYFQRIALEHRLRTALSSGVALLHGATGTGKTMMAASAMRGEATAWLALRDLAPEEAKRRLMQARTQLQRRGRALTIVLDDIDTHGDPRLIESALAAIAATQRELGGAILLTSDRELPPRLSESLGLIRDAELLMPPFDEAETEGFLAQEGCPAGLRTGWTNILTLTSLGHPQLLYARVAEIRAQGFPLPRPSEIVAPSRDSDRVRTEARRIIARMPDEAKELLYRASLVSTRMSRNRLMALARLETALIEPGEAVDRIAGPWLEQMDTDEFRVSPLVRDAAEQARGREWTKATHAKVAWIFLMDAKLTPFDVAAVMGHCLQGGSAGPLAYLLPSLFAKSDEVWQSIGEVCGLYAAFATSSGDRLPFERPLDAFLFRIFQYRIAAAVNADLAMHVAERFDAESTAAAGDDSTLYFRFVFHMQILKQVEVAYPIPALVTRALEFRRVSRELQQSSLGESLRAGLSSNDVELTSSAALGDFVSFALLSRVQGTSDLEQLLDVVEQLPFAERLEITGALVGIPEQAEHIAERLWLERHSSKDPRWEDLRELFHRAVEFGIAASIPALSEAFSVVLVRMVDEQLAAPLEAVRLADSLLARLGSLATLKAAKARALSHAGDAPGAVSIWRKVLPDWLTKRGKLEAAFAHRDGAIAAAKAGEWSLSAEWFKAAMPLGADCSNESFVVGLATDGALARFLGGDVVSGVIGLESTLDLLVQMDGGGEKEPWLSLRRRLAGALGLMAERGPPRDGTLGNVVGMCSNIEPFETGTGVAPPLDLMTLDLVDAALAVGDVRAIGGRHIERLRATRYASLRLIVPSTLMRVARETEDYGLLVRDSLMQADALTERAGVGSQRGDALRLSDGLERPWTDGLVDMALAQMCAAVYDLAAKDRLDEMPLERWRQYACAHSQASGIVAFVDFLDDLFVRGKVDPWRLMVEGRAKTWAEQCAAALASALWQPLSSSQLIQCHAMFAQYLNQPHVMALGAEPVVTLVTRQWGAKAGLRRRGPSTEALSDDVVMVLKTGGRGWEHTKRLLGAVVAMLGLEPDDQTRMQIEAIAVDT
ncbi:hypothetical protein C8J46_109123 [Sphingomonas sp. PP-F2F-A104-K0414]|uniref:hypothetical protein n=1 Tax=Sphingomonas sp. PP-F2F-A104-K0414 TaxID=2135661 RepID=UPI0010470CE6|nr:hypothetical protein [Sphingomonas sp. PP-F2F-A104-K0414]TCP96427.1 hypothetical protein C8J46_109123 [Sphingomonas sp. PP-F2F-A104-K0414]